MFRFLVRELMGWILILLGLGVFYLCISLLLNPSPGPEAILEGPPLAIIGVIIFRGGIHLLKVAVAARICLQTQERDAQPAAAPKRARHVATPLDW